MFERIKRVIDGLYGTSKGVLPRHPSIRGNVPRCTTKDVELARYSHLEPANFPQVWQHIKEKHGIDDATIKFKTCNKEVALSYNFVSKAITKSMTRHTNCKPKNMMFFTNCSCGSHLVQINDIIELLERDLQRYSTKSQR